MELLYQNFILLGHSKEEIEKNKIKKANKI